MFMPPPAGAERRSAGSTNCAINEISDALTSHTGRNSVEPGRFESQRSCPLIGGMRRGMSSRPRRSSRRCARYASRSLVRSSGVSISRSLLAVVVAHSVSNYDQWKRVFDSDQAARKAAGVIGHHINRGADDPNMVYLFMPITDR